MGFLQNAIYWIHSLLVISFLLSAITFSFVYNVAPAGIPQAPEKISIPTITLEPIDFEIS